MGLLQHDPARMQQDQRGASAPRVRGPNWDHKWEPESAYPEAVLEI